jgi:serine/threonine protein kinase
MAETETLELSERLSRYRIDRLLGRGGFGSVYLATDPATNLQVAIKEIPITSTGVVPPESEWTIQKRFECPYIVNIYDFWSEPKRFIMVMEYINGGELFDALVNRGAFSENSAAVLIQQVLIGLKVLHDNNVVHRDLKPENLLLHFLPDGAFICKICDFGLAGMFSQERMRAFCGTTGWAAPEIMKNIPYDASVDVWSLGCILYALISATRPFDTDDDYELYEMVTSGDIDYEREELDGVSDAAKDLMRKMLEVDPKKRITIEDALQHTWIKGNAPSVKLDNLHQHLKIYNVKRKLKRVTEVARAAARLAALAE